MPTPFFLFTVSRKDVDGSELPVSGFDNRLAKM